MKKKIVELVLENCQVIQFDAEDIYTRFDIVGCTIWHGTKFINIKNVLIIINKKAKAKILNFEDKSWQERLKIPDITHICFDGEDYSISEYEGDYENKLQRLSENEDSFIINISKEVKSESVD